MRFEAVLFDCDGVLVDSEPITNGVLRDMLAEAGWLLTPAECMRLFVGKAVKDEAALIEANTGRPLTEDWLHAFRLRRNNALLRDLQAIRNVHAAVDAVHARLQGRIACASGADRSTSSCSGLAGIPAPRRRASWTGCSAGDRRLRRCRARPSQRRSRFRRATNSAPGWRLSWPPPGSAHIAARTI